MKELEKKYPSKMLKSFLFHNGISVTNFAAEVKTTRTYVYQLFDKTYLPATFAVKTIKSYPKFADFYEGSNAIPYIFNLFYN